MRGRLIFPVYATIARLDTEANETAGNYDPIFREPIKRDEDGSGIGKEQREEKAPVDLKVQVETDRQELQRLTQTGDLPDSTLGLVAHMVDLERGGYVGTDGRLAFAVNDRLVKITDARGQTVMTFDRVPLYCTHVKRIDGWLGRTSNLVLLTFAERPQGLT